MKFDARLYSEEIVNTFSKALQESIDARILGELLEHYDKSWKGNFIEDACDPQVPRALRNQYIDLIAKLSTRTVSSKFMRMILDVHGYPQNAKFGNVYILSKKDCRLRGTDVIFRRAY